MASKYFKYLCLSLLLLSPFIININFSVAASNGDPVIDLISPNGGEVYTVGDEVNIKWNQTNIDTVTIGYKACDSCLDWIEFGMQVDINNTTGSYKWTIPENLSAGNYKIDITGYHTGIGSMIDISQADFIIKVADSPNEPEPTTNITDPSELPKENAYKAIVKIKTLFLDRYYNLSPNSEGSGVVINSDGLILSNYHVITVEEELDDSIRDAVYQICIPKNISEEPDCAYTAKVIARDKNLDMAILKIESIAGLSTLQNFSYLDLDQSDITQTGDEVIALGYPAIGGETITITKGIVSGKADKYGQKWIKTDAVTSFGSSGGAAINSTGKVIGITSQAHSDLLGTLGYIINISSVTNWVNQNKNNTAQTNTLLNRLVEFTKGQRNLKTTNIFTKNYPPFSITKVTDWNFNYAGEGGLFIDKKSDDEGGLIKLEFIKYPHLTSLDNIIPELKRQYAEVGLLSMISFVDDKKININGVQGKQVVISGAGEMFYAYIFPVKNYLVIINYDYGKNDKDKETVDRIINTFKSNASSTVFNEERQFSNSNNPKFSFQAGKNWAIMTNNSKTVSAYVFHKNIKGAFVQFEASRITEDTKNLNNDEFLAYVKQQLAEANQIVSRLDLKGEIVKSDAHYKINNEVDNVIMVESVAKSISSGKTIDQALTYTIKLAREYLIVTLDLYSENQTEFNTVKSELNSMLQSLSLSAKPLATITPMIDNKFASRLKGKLLLQVEDRGRIWYVNPNNAKRHEVTFANALNLFQRLALGISNTDLYKILTHPESVSRDVDTDGDGFLDRSEVEAGYNPEIASNPKHRGNDKIKYNTSLANRLKGKLLLQVENKGRIWYVDFEGKRWEVTWKNLMDLFRKLALGITNNDLSQIDIGN